MFSVFTVDVLSDVENCSLIDDFCCTHPETLTVLQMGDDGDDGGSFHGGGLRAPNAVVKADRSRYTGLFNWWARRQVRIMFNNDDVTAICALARRFGTLWGPEIGGK